VHVEDGKVIEVHVGIDDVDSLKGGCTTHFAVEVSWKLKNKNIKFTDYPNLVRLNPAVPWKTRGNGAVALRLLLTSESDIEDVWGFLTNELEEYTRCFPDPKHQPSAVLHVGEVPREYVWLAQKALHDIVPLDLALRAISKHENTRYYSITGKRGIIGALSAVGYTMKNTDYTFEVVAYRERSYWGKPRLVDEESVRDMDRLYCKDTVLNYDYEFNRVLITPRGPDPVLFGVRGESPETLLEAIKVLRVHEPVEYVAMFRTNQHTDSHIFPVSSICDIRPYTCISARGIVKNKPTRAIGGHVFFRLCDQHCCVDVAVYEPTKHFRNVVEKLEAGDEVEVLGCVRPPGPAHDITVNLEKIRVIKLVTVTIYENPRCPHCGSRMESAGRNKGFKCRKCGHRDPGAKKFALTARRELEAGWYQPPKIAFKHLMKPIERFGREKKSFAGPVLENFIVKSP